MDVGLVLAVPVLLVTIIWCLTRDEDAALRARARRYRLRHPRT